MKPDIPDTDLPVPDPDGNPIHLRELDTAERRMLADLQREEPPVLQEPNGDLHSARTAVERQNSREMNEDQAAAYRLAPDDMLDWLEDKTTAPDVEVLEHWENHLDWLETDTRGEPKRDEEPWPEPERT